MRISDWSSDVCSSDLHGQDVIPRKRKRRADAHGLPDSRATLASSLSHALRSFPCSGEHANSPTVASSPTPSSSTPTPVGSPRSEERRFGQERVSTGTSRGRPYPTQQNKQLKYT